MEKDISFASFNLLNLQLPGSPTYPGSKLFTEETYQARLAWCAMILKEMDADVIAFQELWSAQALRDLFVFAGLADKYELIFIKEQWYEIAVAAAVKKHLTVKTVTLHKNFPEGFKLIKRGAGSAGADEVRTDDDMSVNISIFARTVMQLTIEITGAGLPEIEVFCVHLKSKGPTTLDKPEQEISTLDDHTAALGAAISTIRRTAEAAALRMLLTTTMKHNDRPVVVLGDLNDGEHSNTLAILTAQPAFRRYASSRIGGSSDTGLYASCFLQALSDFNNVAYTYIFNDVREQLDHVLVSEQFYDHSKKRIWSFKDQRIWNDHLYIENLSGPERPASDHGIVKVRFRRDQALP